jgi:uncharacterized protein YegP (UPF0339 family)
MHLNAAALSADDFFRHPKIPLRIRADARDADTIINKPSNGEIILASERYTSRDSAKAGIASVKTNATVDERYVRRESSNGQLYFVLRAGNNEILGTSEMYKSAAAREGGIAAVKANAPLAVTEG